jgi:hypothetical protein
MSYEERHAAVTLRVWQRWTKYGLGLDGEAMADTMKTVRDAVASTYREHIEDGDGYDAVLARLGSRT